MKCSIITFHTAHNYGAVLQAYALKGFILAKDCSVQFVDYVPASIRNVYSINPFRRPVGCRAICKRVLLLYRQIPQYRLFKDFIRNELIDGKQSTGSLENYSRVLNESDMAICGSDQIWNDSITGKISQYYLAGASQKLIKISYAASFGKKELSTFQRKCIKEYLPSFARVSLREKDGQKEIEAAIAGKVAIVLDPVFLLSAETWSRFADSATAVKKGQYIVYYSLKDNADLVRGTEQMAATLGFPIYIVHPIGFKQNIQGEQLYNVGPYEFVRLIRDAECVCTNSFHAAAFSILFGKKYFHVTDTDKETRVESLLERLNSYQSSATCLGGQNILDFKTIDRSLLQEQILQSQAFLNAFLKSNNAKDK